MKHLHHLNVIDTHYLNMKSLDQPDSIPREGNHITRNTVKVLTLHEI